MDFVKGKTGEQTGILIPEHRKQLRTAVEKLRAEGLVFGDLRRPNVIVSDEGTVKLIDFEWCGEEGGQGDLPQSHQTW